MDSRYCGFGETGLWSWLKTAPAFGVYGPGVRGTFCLVWTSWVHACKAGSRAGLGFRVLGFRVLGFRGSGFRVLGFWGLGFKV